MTDVTFTIRLTGEDRGGEAVVRRVVAAVKDLRNEASGATRDLQGVTSVLGGGAATPAVDRVVTQVQNVATAEREAAAAAKEMAAAVSQGAQQAATGQRATATATEKVVEALDRTTAAQKGVVDGLGRDIPAAAKRMSAELVSAFEAPDADFAAIIEKFNQLQLALQQGPEGFDRARALAAELEQETRGVTAAIGDVVKAFVAMGGSVSQIPPEFSEISGAYITVEQNAERLNRQLQQGAADAFPATEAAAARLRESLEAVVQVSARVTQAEEQGVQTSTRNVAGTKKLQNAFQQLVFSATGIPGVVGRTASALAQFATGGVIATTVVAGLGLLANYWRNLTKELKRNREEADRTADALVDAAFANRGLDIAQNINLLQGELDSELEKVAKVQTGGHGVVNQFDVIRKLFTGKDVTTDLVDATSRVGKLSLGLAELRKQYLRFLDELPQARGEALVAGLEAERQRVAELSAQLEQAATADFAEGKISVEAFFKARREAMATAFAAEIQAAKAHANELARRAAAEATVDPRSADAVRAATAAAAARAQVQQLELRRQGQLAQLTRDQAAAELEVVNRVNEFNAALAEAQGNLEKASLNRLETQIAEARQELVKFDLSADEIERRLNDFRTARIAQIRLEAIQQAVDRAFAETDRLRSEVQAQVDAGLITEREGQRQILAIERSRLPVLAALRAQLLAIAQTVKDPAAAAAIANLVTQLDNAAAAAARTGRAALDLELELRNVAESELVRFLTSTATEARSVGEAFKQFARDAVAAINEVIARILVMKALDAIGFGFSGGGEVPQQKATGGLVHGPRMPVDQVPVWLTGGEYVFDTRSVERAGLPFLQALHAALRGGLATPSVVRANRLPGRFAEGGLVLEGGAGAGRTDRLQADIGLEDGLVLRQLETSAGFRTVLRIIASNPKAFNGALGRG